MLIQQRIGFARHSWSVVISRLYFNADGIFLKTVVTDTAYKSLLLSIKIMVYGKKKKSAPPPGPKPS